MSFYCEQVQPNGMVVTTEHRPEIVSTWGRLDEWPVSFGAAKTKRNPVYIPESGNFTHDANYNVSWTTPWAEHWDGRSPWVVRDLDVTYGGPPGPHPSTKGRYLVILTFVRAGQENVFPSPLYKFPSSSYLSLVATYFKGTSRVDVVGHDGVCVSAPSTTGLTVTAEYLFEGSTMPFRNQLGRDQDGALVTLPDTRKPPRRVVRRPRFVDPQIEA